MEVFTYVASLKAGDSQWSPELLSSTSQIPPNDVKFERAALRDVGQLGAQKAHSCAE